MSGTRRVRLQVATGLVAALVAVGCVTRRPGMVARDRLVLETAGADGVHVMWADVYHEDGEAVVVGSLTTRGVGTRRHTGHVDVEVLDSCGRPTTTAHSGPIYIYRRGPGKGSRITRFQVPLQGEVAVGGTVRVSFHAGTHETAHAGS